MRLPHFIQTHQLLLDEASLYALIFERDEVRELGLGHVVIGVGKADEFLDLVAEDLTCLRRCATRRNRPGC